MDIFERRETPGWRAIITALQNAAGKSDIQDSMVAVYMMGREDAGESFEFNDETAQATIHVAQTLIDFREKLIKEGNMSSGLADQLTLNHHHALFTKDFIKMTRDTNDSN